MKTKSAIAKGKLLEDYVAEQIRLKGIDAKAYRAHGSGNGTTEKADIWTSMMVLGQNAGIECKNHSTLCIPDWWRQTKKLESLGREPILAFKIFGEPLPETKVVIYLDTFLDLVKEANENLNRKAAESARILRKQKELEASNLHSNDDLLRSKK